MTPEKPGRLGIITALPAEANCFSTASFPFKEIITINETLIIVSGMGAENAASATQQLINHGATALVSWGTAGGLSKDLQPGDILLPESVLLNNENQKYQTDHNWRQQLLKSITSDLKTNEGLLLHSDTVVTNTEQKLELHKKTKAIAVDMESGAIAQIADQNKLPFLIIRSVVDSSDESIPISAINSVDEFGQTKPFYLISNLLKKPGDIPKLIKLGSHFQQARKSLKQVSKLAGTLLAVPE